MADISKISPDDGSTILNIKDSNAVHWADNTILGAKNLLLCTTMGSSIFTIDSKGIATANGGSTSRVWFMYSNGGLFLPKGRYIVNGLPSQGSNSTFDFFIRKHGQDHGQDIYTNETIIDVTEDTTYDLFISLFVNYTASNLVFKPMVRRISDTDSTFAPYAMTNRELTTKAQGIINAATNAADFAAFKTAIGNL